MTAGTKFVIARMFAIAALTPGLALAAQSAAVAAPKARTPNPAITSAPATWSNSRTATFTVTDTRSDAVLSCSLDGAAFATCTSPKTYTGLSEASHTFRVKATAPGLRASAVVSRSWAVDVTSPTAPTVSQPASPSNIAAPSISFASSSVDVTSYRCALAPAAAGTCTSPATVDPGADGWHTFTVTAVDRAGNVSAPASVTWYRDTVTPTPVVNNGPVDPTTSTSATFAFASSEAGTTYTCSLDSAAWSACASGDTYAGLALGTHTFQVRSTDSVGNTADSLVYTWHVTPAQTTTLAWSDPSALPAANTNVKTASFTFSATGATTVTCHLDLVALACAAGSPTAVSGLADGEHSFTVVADQGLATQVAMAYSWNVDTVPPGKPLIVAPTGRQATTQASVTVMPSSLSDSLACKIDVSSHSCASPVTLSGLSQGSHTFTVTERDPAGNAATASASWIVDTVAPTVVVTQPSSITTAAKFAFSEPVHGVSTSSVVLRTATGTVVSAVLACRTSTSTATSCASALVRQATLQPRTALVPGEHYQLAVNPAGHATVVDLTGNAALGTSKAFRGTLTQQETTPAARWSWRRVASKTALGGSYVYEHRAGAAVTWQFSGTSITWVTVTGPAFGRAQVYVDGVRKLSANNYASALHTKVARTVTGLAKGKHTVRILVTGKKGSTRGTDTRVAVDAFRVGSTTWATPALLPTWQRVAVTAASGGHVARADLAGSSVSFTFRGTGVTWTSATGPTLGKAAVYVDGVLVRTVDSYASAWHYRVARSLTSLTDKRHVLKLVVLGTHNRRAKGSNVIVDGWTVR